MVSTATGGVMLQTIVDAGWTHLWVISLQVMIVTSVAGSSTRATLLLGAESQALLFFYISSSPMGFEISGVLQVPYIGLIHSQLCRQQRVAPSHMEYGFDHFISTSETLFAEIQRGLCFMADAPYWTVSIGTFSRTFACTKKVVNGLPEGGFSHLIESVIWISVVHMFQYKHSCLFVYARQACLCMWGVAFWQARWAHDVWFRLIHLR